MRTRPKFITVVGLDNEAEAELWNEHNGTWHAIRLDGGKPCGTMPVDDMPAHWIEQLRRYAILGREIDRRNG